MYSKVLFHSDKMFAFQLNKLRHIQKMFIMELKYYYYSVCNSYVEQKQISEYYVTPITRS